MSIVVQTIDSFQKLIVFLLYQGQEIWAHSTAFFPFFQDRKSALHTLISGNLQFFFCR